MHRLHTVATHISPNTDSDSAALLSLKRDLVLQSYRAAFMVSNQRLKEMAHFMIHEMHLGLAKDGGSTLGMFPSFVYRKKTSHANGAYYALDLGGTNFRVIRMELKNGELMKYKSEKFAVPVREQTADNAEALFDFLARCVAEFQEKSSPEDKNLKDLPLGFTFSFPMKQTAIDHGVLVNWTKGFTTKGVKGEDVVQLLQKSLNKKKLNVRTTALCNDTVGTLVAKFFTDKQTEMGVILGTGSNACYWETASSVVKDANVVAHGDTETVINMEFGNFDSQDMFVLPRTAIDDEIDKCSPNPGKQRMEKMISGYYMGEMARLMMLNLVTQHKLLPEKLAKKLSERNSFHSVSLSNVLMDRAPGFHKVGEIMKKEYQLDLSDDEKHRELVYFCCYLVTYRAAQLAGMAIAATLLKSGKQGSATVAIDGSVFEKTVGFRGIMQRTIEGIVGGTEGECDVRLVHQADGSGHGAGFIAALTASS